MRNIKKTLKVKEVQMVVYDTVKKCETVLSCKLSEAEKEPQIPEGCVLVSVSVISEKEVTYKMTPQDFVKYAAIEE